MKLESVKLRGFLGIRKGLGLDDISLDLSSLSGLVALAGPNGRGKSTLLENLTPFRTLASRKRALQHHVGLRDSFRDLSFRWNGDAYRSLIKIDSDSEKQEAFLWQNGASLVNGKVREYDKAIIDLFGSEALFFNSVFCAQNSAKITDMRPGDLKALFAEFLRLDRYIAFEQTSKQVGQVLAGQVSALDREMEYMRRIVEAAKDLGETLKTKTEEQNSQSRVIFSLKADAQKLQEDLARAREAVQKNVIVQERVATLEKALKTLFSTIETARRESETTLKAFQAKSEKLESEIKGFKTTLEEAEIIRQSAGRVEQMEKDIASLSAEREKFQAAKDEIAPRIDKLREALTSAQEKIRSLSQDRKLAVLEAEMKAMEETGKDLGLRDPACRSTTCTFIVKALKAVEGLEPKKAEIAAYKLALALKSREAEADKQTAEDQLHRLRKEEEHIQTTLTTLRKSISEQETALKPLKPLAAKLPQVEVAQARLETAQDRWEQNKEDWENAVNARNKNAWTQEQEKATLESDIRLATAEINYLADKTMKALESDIRVNQETIEAAQTDLAAADKEIAAMEGQIAEAERHKAQLAILEEQRQQISQDIGEWQYLQTACGANGLRALEIDSVAPGISAYSNALLSQAFGPLFTVRFRTQDEETGKEVLEIPVMREDGSEPLLENLSGGEKIWILKALRLAMTLISKEKSARNFLTAFADEEDGALDVDNALNFVRLYRAFMQAGGFQDLFFISHKPDVVAMADHVIQFEERGVTIQ